MPKDMTCEELLREIGTLAVFQTQTVGEAKEAVMKEQAELIAECDRQCRGEAVS